MAPPAASSACSSGIVTSPDELQTPCAYYLLTWGGAAAAACKKKKEEDEDFDLFGEPSEADKAKAKELAQSKKAEGTKKKKKEIIEKSSLVIDIKPGSAETDLDRVLKMVRAIEMDGMTWNQASKKVPIAFGLYKLQVACTIEDAKVNTNELVEKIEALGLTEEQAAKRAKQAEEGDDSDAEEGDEDEEEDYLVQSAEIISFSKL